jgi:hypothetical protein
MSTGRKQRPGVCHRCGWMANVGKITRRDRRYAVTPNDYARLCDDCITVVFHGGTPERAASQGNGHVKLTVVQNREVA